LKFEESNSTIKTRIDQGCGVGEALPIFQAGWVLIVVFLSLFGFDVITTFLSSVVEGSAVRRDSDSSPC
jgi:hypothetical protein